ncbi:Ig-like domain-containing protein [bacterium]|nr:Ig-like domain-containing protein [bacterium]NUN46376.1 Ig-like domain-containing protein [bacterium]
MQYRIYRAYAFAFMLYAFSINAGEIQITVVDINNAPIADIDIQTNITHQTLRTDGNGYVSISIQTDGVYDIQLSHHKTSIGALPDVFARRHETLSIHIKLLKTERNGYGIYSTNYSHVSFDGYGIQTISSKQQSVMTGKHVENYLLHLPAAVSTSNGKSERTRRYHVRSDFDYATGYSVNGNLISDITDGLPHLRIPHRAIRSVTIHEGGTNTSIGMYNHQIDIQTKEGTDRWSLSTSGMTDAFSEKIGFSSYGKRSFDADISGPVIPGLFYLYAAAESESFDDSDPSVVGIPQYQIKQGNSEYYWDQQGVFKPKDTVVWRGYKNGARDYEVNSDHGLYTYMQGTLLFSKNYTIKIAHTYNEQKSNLFDSRYLLSKRGGYRKTSSSSDFTAQTFWKCNKSIEVLAGFWNYSYKDRMADRRLFRSDNYAIRNLQTYGTGTTGGRTYFNDNLFFDIGAGPYLFSKRETQTTRYFTQASFKIPERNDLLVGGVSYTIHEIRHANIIDYLNQPNDLIGYTLTDNLELIKTVSGMNGARKPVEKNAFAEYHLHENNINASIGLHALWLKTDARMFKNPINPTGSDGFIHTNDFADVNSITALMPRFSIQTLLSERLTASSHIGWYRQNPGLKNWYVNSELLAQMINLGPYALTLGNPSLQLPKVFSMDAGAQMKTHNGGTIDFRVFLIDVQKSMSINSQLTQPHSTIVIDNQRSFSIQGLSVGAKIPLTLFWDVRLFGQFINSKAEGNSFDTEGFRAVWLGWQRNVSMPLIHTRPLSFNIQSIIHFDQSAPTTVLSHSTLFVEYTSASGFPYSRTEVNPSDITGIPPSISSDPLSETAPSSRKVNLKLTKSFKLDNTEFSIFIECTNLLNNKNPVTVFPATGQANDNGYLATSDFQSLPTHIRDRRYSQYKVRFRDGTMYEPGREIWMGISIHLWMPNFGQR